MKILFLFFMAVSQSFAFDLKLKEAKSAEENILGKTPLLEILSQRDSSSALLDLAGDKFTASYSLDNNWDLWFYIKPQIGLGAGAWKLEKLNDKVFYSYGQTKAIIAREQGTIFIQYSRYENIEISEKELFEKLYDNSPKITFGGLVTYAYLRNISPLSEKEGIITLRKDNNGNLFYSLTQDFEINGKTRWLMAANGVLYGLKISNGELVFVSKPINIQKLSFLNEEKTYPLY
ncbi:MAG: hypothetical protein GX447_00855 [Elusimicrobia bacterium]|nr:hypothetical protein [Elusimicrobiota bacterium]